MKMARTLSVLLLAAAGAFAQDDPLKSPACGEALARLQAARGSTSTPATVDGLRSAAAATCLGAGAPPTRAARVLQQPVVVPPPQIEAPAPVAPFAAPALPPPPVAIERPAAPAHCDAGGCWTSDGTHLRLVPPALAGPRGLCTQQGGLVYCP